MILEIYTAQNLNVLPWNEIENGEKLKILYGVLLANSSDKFVVNSGNSFSILRIDHSLFLLTEGSRFENQNYLTSIVSQFLGYSREEVLKGEKYPEHIKTTLNLLYPILKKLYVGFGSEEVVFIHNLYFATCLYPKLKIDYKQLTDFLQSKFPKKALVFRSINQETDASWFDGLEAQNFQAIAARQIYILDPQKGTHKKKRPYVMDEKLWQKSDHLEWQKVENWTDKELSKTLEFYEDLYIKKHSSYNPFYTKLFIQKLTESKVLDFYLLQTKDNTEVVAVQAICETNEVLVTPFIGYDFSAPKEWGLYRLMSQQLIALAEEKGKVLNMSSGASDFKKQRGGEATIDYLMVYSAHLSLRKKLFWKFMKFVSEKITIPMFEKFGV